MLMLLVGKEANGVFLSDDRGSNMQGTGIVMGRVKPNSLVPVRELLHGKLPRLCQFDLANLSVCLLAQHNQTGMVAYWVSKMPMHAPAVTT